MLQKWITNVDKQGLILWWTFLETVCGIYLRIIPLEGGETEAFIYFLPSPVVESWPAVMLTYPYI